MTPPPHAGADVADEPDALWLTGGPWPLFAWAHRPEGAALGSVVLCPPLLAERDAAHPAYRALGAALASAGLAAVRLDVEGVGDAGGPAVGSQRVAAWLDAVDRGVEAARGLAEGPVALVGMRSGALLAAAAAEYRGDVDALVLWDPWRSGAAFLRRAHALGAPPAPVSRWHAGVAVAGVVVEPAAARALGALRLPAALRVRRALVLARRGDPAPALPLSLRPGGSAARTLAEVQPVEPGEEEAVVAGPRPGPVPEATTARAVRWLADALASLRDEGGPSRPVAPAPVVVCGPVAVPPAAPGDRTVFERARRVGEHGLFAVETVADPGRPGVPVVVFVAGGPHPHTGPGRLWVLLARRWAALGARCVRADLSGWGESAPRPGRRSFETGAPEGFADVRDLVAALGDPGRVVLVGASAGAYQVLESALELGPLGVLALDPLLRFVPPEAADGQPRAAVRRLCEPAHGGPGARRRARGRDAWAWLEALGAAGTHVYVALGAAAAAALRVPAATGRVRVDVLEALDRVPLSASDVPALADRLTEELHRILLVASGALAEGDGAA